MKIMSISDITRGLYYSATDRFTVKDNNNNIEHNFNIQTLVQQNQYKVEYSFTIKYSSAFGFSNFAQMDYINTIKFDTNIINVSFAENFVLFLENIITNTYTNDTKTSKDYLNNLVPTILEMFNNKINNSEMLVDDYFKEYENVTNFTDKDILKFLALNRNFSREDYNTIINNPANDNIDTLAFDRAFFPEFSEKLNDDELSFTMRMFKDNVNIFDTEIMKMLYAIYCVITNDTYVYTLKVKEYASINSVAINFYDPATLIDSRIIVFVETLFNYHYTVEPLDNYTMLMISTLYSDSQNNYYMDYFNDPNVFNVTDVENINHYEPIRKMSNVIIMKNNIDHAKSYFERSETCSKIEKMLKEKMAEPDNLKAYKYYCDDFRARIMSNTYNPTAIIVQRYIEEAKTITIEDLNFLEKFVHDLSCVPNFLINGFLEILTVEEFIDIVDILNINNKKLTIEQSFNYLKNYNEYKDMPVSWMLETL